MKIQYLIAALFGVLASIPSQAQLRILPIGDSITEGFHPQHDYFGGYREYLEDSLEADGIVFDFVGSRSVGSRTIDKDHEGYGGIETWELRNEILANNLVANANPDIILLKIGTNDILTNSLPNYNDLRGNFLAPLFDAIEAQSGNAKIVVSEIMPCGVGLNNYVNYNNLVNNYNIALVDEVSSRQAQGKPYYLVNDSGWSEALISFDGIHPDDNGYAFLASKFKQVLDANGLLTLPPPPPPLPSSGSDFNGDGSPDVIYRNLTTGATVIHYLDQGQFLAGGTFTAPQTLNWQIVGCADFDGDGGKDVLYRDPSTGQAVVHYMIGRQFIAAEALDAVVSPSWDAVGVGDFNADGKPDILFRNQTSGLAVIHYLDGVNFQAGGAFTYVVPPLWGLDAIGDFDANGYPDVAYTNPDGRSVIHYLRRREFLAGGLVTYTRAPSEELIGAADFNGDGFDDLLYRSTQTGVSKIGFIIGRSQIGVEFLSATVPPSWSQSL